MLNLNHKNLDVWKRSLELIAMIYSTTKDFPKEEIFGITNQVKRAGISIASNLAEGSARKNKPDRKRFFEIARSSLVEVDAQIEIAIKLGYLNDDQIIELDRIVNHIFAMLSKLIQKQ
jgi:four helix bundle protein